MAGTIVADTIQNGAGTSTSMDNAIYGSAKAWVNFNGVSGVSIRTSYNVSSVTRSGAGAYTVNFTNAFVDGNYSVAACSSPATINNGRSTALSIYSSTSTAPSTTACSFINNDTGNATVDSLYACISFFR